MAKFTCMRCGSYAYNSNSGDPSQEIPPGTSFEGLPDEWSCPECHAPKEEFAPVEGE